MSVRISFCQTQRTATRLSWRWRFASFARFFVAVLLVSGCSSKQGRIHAPEIDAIGAGKAAMEQYDTNEDGKIAGEELLAAPSLAAALEKLDANGDGAISADEITARILLWQESKLGLTPAICTVYYENQPLVGAKVVFEPEKFLGGHVETFEGLTNQQGMTNLSRSNSEVKFPGVAQGLYLIRITSRTTQIPARYNTHTTLGTEVIGDAGTAHGGLVLKLE